MKRTDFTTGIKHTFYVYGRDAGFMVAYTLAVLILTLIAGGSLWIPGACLILTLLRVASTISQSARNAAEARAFYEYWLASNPEAASADD